MKHVLTVKREYVPCCNDAYCRHSTWSSKTKYTITCSVRDCGFVETRVQTGEQGDFPHKDLEMMSLDHRISVLESMHVSREGGFDARHK